ncbi:MAG: HAD family hydrolase [Candidatus Bathyarchaeota archaeon]|nr:MAG: HAD family hydrolase [Candidatus Bathyarchaeota archaeon]
MGRPRIVSFDLDGTITDTSFVDSVWLEGIPRLSAIKNGVSFEEAQKSVIAEYNKIGRKRLEWYDLSYWIERFGINISPEEILDSFAHKIKAFSEVPEVLEELRSEQYRLIIVTNARREFADPQLERTEIKRYFEHVFSATSDFGLVKKNTRLYRRICDICHVSPKEMVHVGDDRFFDYTIPRRLGILAFHLDRTHGHSGNRVIHSLQELSEKLSRKQLKAV